MIEPLLFQSPSTPVPMLRCKCCKEFKPWAAFHRRPGSARGIAVTCKECTKLRNIKLRSTKQWQVDRDARHAAIQAYGMMRCGKCKITQPISEFTRNALRSGGYNHRCNACFRIDYRRAWTRRILSSIRASARAKGIIFSLTIDDVSMPDFCPVLGIPLEFREKGKRDNSPSVDRIVPSKGYVPGNVAVISFLANRLKSNCTDPAVFEAIARYLRERVAA